MKGPLAVKAQSNLVVVVWQGPLVLGQDSLLVVVGQVPQIEIQI